MLGFYVRMHMNYVCTHTFAYIFKKETKGKTKQKLIYMVTCKRRDIERTPLNVPCFTVFT